MRIAVIGAGKMGCTLARVWARAGHQLAIGCRRERRDMVPIIADLSPRIRAMTTWDAGHWGALIVLALPWSARVHVAHGTDWSSGKILLDTMNAYGPYPTVVDLGGMTSSEIVASDFPQARVVKGLNTLQARLILDAGLPTGSEGRIAVPVCGNDTAAKRVVASLIDDIGFDVIDIGSLPSGRWSEPEQPLFGKNYSAPQLIELFRECRVSAVRLARPVFSACAGKPLNCPINGSHGGV